MSAELTPTPLPMTDVKDRLAAAYRALVVSGTAHPTPAELAERAGVSEADTYLAFPTADAVGRYAWRQLYDQVNARLEASATFQTYGARERMLAYNFTFFEVALAERSFILATYERSTLLADYREQFRLLHADWVSEGVAADELRERLTLSNYYPDLLWSLHHRLISFWAHDTSEHFAQTERAIEIYSKVPLEFMGTNILDSAAESIKFAVEQLRPERLTSFFRF